MDISLTVNGERRSASVPPETTLLALLRDALRLTSAKLGCDVGDCGACTVLVDGLPVNSCLMLAGQADGRDVQTIEGLATRDRLHPLQQAFEVHASLQCVDCHATLKGKELPHDDVLPKPQCASCHSKAVTAYAGSLFLGVVLVLGYYFWR